MCLWRRQEVDLQRYQDLIGARRAENCGGGKRYQTGTLNVGGIQGCGGIVQQVAVAAIGALQAMDVKKTLPMKSTRLKFNSGYAEQEEGTYLGYSLRSIFL